MTCWALVPIKERSACKTRLDPTLLPDARRRLVRALLDHVIGTLRNTPGIDHIALVSPERDGIAADIELFDGTRSGLNEDLTFALSEAAARGAHCAVIIPADLPFLTPTDVGALLGSLKRTESLTPPRWMSAAIAPDRHGRGTNALAVALPPPFDLAFGENSFARHLAAIRAQGCEPAVVRRDGLSFDVDNAEDLWRLKTHALWATLPLASGFAAVAASSSTDSMGESGCRKTIER